MRKFKALAPVDAAGVDFSRPRDQRTWANLVNVWFNAGFLETRPGLRPVGPLSVDISSRGAGIITAIGEARNWAAETSSIGLTQRLKANSTSANSTWTIVGAATVHEAIDDVQPDNYTTYIKTQTDGDYFTVGFANTSGTPDFINDVVLHVRVVALSPPLKQRLYFNVGPTLPDTATAPYIDISNTDYTDYDAGTSDGFVDYYIPLTDVTLNYIAVDALTVTTKFVQDALPVVVYVGPSTTGSDDDFTPSGVDNWISATEGAPGPYTFENCDGQAFDLTPSIVTGTPGDRVSVQFDAAAMPAGTLTISDVGIYWHVASSGSGPCSATVYHVGTDAVRRTVGTLTINQPYQGMPWDAGFGKFAEQLVTVSTNPETGVAWTTAEVEAGLEFGITVDSGSANVVFDYASLRVDATIPSGGVGGVAITQMEILAGSRTSTGTPSSDQFLGRVMATTTSFYRLDDQRPINNGDLVDILDAAAAPTSAWPSWSIAEAFGSLYFENSTDTTYVFDGGASTMTQLTAPLPLGHTMWTFAQRVFKGDTISGGTRMPKRTSWCVIANADDWTGPTSGDLDLTHGGEGRIRKGALLSAMESAVYLDKGIYTLRWTGDDDAPFVPQLMDRDTGIVGPNTCQAILDQGGEAVHLFMGRGPQGLSVYGFDGSTAQNVGGEIEYELRRLVNPNNIDSSFAAVDPERNLYLLFVPEGSQIFPEQAWVYHIDNGHWTRWTFPFGITAAGIWTLFAQEELGSSTLYDRDGTKYLILGTTLGIPYLFNPAHPSDWVSMPGSRDDTHGTGYFTSNDTDLSNPSAALEKPIDWTIETGALVLSDEDVRRQTAPMRLWLTYENRGLCGATLDVSRDGGAHFATGTDFSVGVGGIDFAMSLEPATLREAVVDVASPAAGRRHSFRLTQNADTDFPKQMLKISKILIEYEDRGEMP